MRRALLLVFLLGALAGCMSVRLRIATLGVPWCAPHTTACEGERLHVLCGPSGDLSEFGCCRCPWRKP